MALKTSGEKTKSVWKGRARAVEHKDRARPSKPAALRSRKGSPSSAGRARLSSLPVLSLWLLAIITLAGLIYWGEGSRKSHSSSVAIEDRSAPRAKTPSAQTTPPPPNRGPVFSHIPAREPSQSPSGNSSISTVGAAPTDRGFRMETSQEKPPEPEPDRALSLALVSPTGKQGVSPQPVQPPPGPALSPPKARIAIVIDDLGLDLGMARKFLSLPLSITFSVLPFLPHSNEVAELAHSQGREVMLHLPMEPRGYPKVNPGRGALLLSMSGGEVQRSMRSAIDASPYIRGINNHMGSRFTEDPAMMRFVLAEIQRRELYFLDSRTSERSVSASLARELRIPHATRDIFLDHTVSESAVRSQMEQLIGQARIRGTAVAIGHPHEVTVKVLSRFAPRLQEEHIRVVPASELVAVEQEEQKSRR